MDEWRWGTSGVRVDGDQLVWFEELGAVAPASGAATTQLGADFLRDGPPFDGVPTEVLVAVAHRLGA